MATPPPSLSSSKSIISTAATTEKPQPIPWTHQETLHLIQGYQEKWYSLERGQLKSSQWEEVAVTVAARCGYNDFDPYKTSVQCRHKMEKLRQRYRAEKQRLSLGTASHWHYFDLMNNLLRGPLPISARPMASIPYDNDEEDHTAEKSDNFNTDEEDEEEEDKNRSKSRSITNILRRPINIDGSSSRRRNRDSGRESEEEGDIRASRFPEKRSAAEEDDMAGEAAEGKEMYSKLAAEIRLFAERLVGMENTKLEMMKEAEMNRMAMENKRIEMILESEQKIVNSIAKAFGSPKRLKIGQES